MSNCILCGKEEMQEYTLDEIFTCNACMEKSNTSIHDDKINSTSNYINILTSQLNFLQEQLQEKDHFIQQLLTLVKDKTQISNFNFSKVSASSPMINNSIATPPILMEEDSKIHTPSAPSEMDQNTFIITDEYRCSDSINQQLKNIRLEFHNDYLKSKSKSIYSDMSDSLSESKSSSENYSNNLTHSSFINKASIEKRKKIKDALDKLSNNNLINRARYRVQDQPFPWPKGTTLVVGDSMIQGIEENKLKRYKAKIRSFPGSTIDDLYDYIKPLLKKKPTNVIIHCGTNDAQNKSAGMIINELNNLKIHIEEVNPGTNVFFSTPIIRKDDVTLDKKLQEVASYLNENYEKLVTSKNIDYTCLGRKGLHLNPKGSGRLAINLISLMKCL